MSDRVADTVRRLRKARAWSLADLAGRCGLSENSIENIEHGRRKDGRRTRAVTVDELYELARAFQVGITSLLPAPLPGDILDGLDHDELVKMIGQLQTIKSLQEQRIAGFGKDDHGEG